MSALPGNLSKYITIGGLAHFRSHIHAVVSGKYNQGGDSEEPVVSLGVYVSTKPQDGISLLLLSVATQQPTRP